MSIVYLLGWLLPWAAGTGICLALNRGCRQPGDVAAALGMGFLLGVFLAALLSSILATGDTAAAFARSAPWLAVITLSVWIAAWLARRPRGLPRPAVAPMGIGAWALWSLLLVAILLRLEVIASEALLRPTFPWDAWSAWAVKPKAWFLLDHYLPYVSMQEWLQRPDANLRTAAIWDYPELLAWGQIWFASAAGGWNEPLINLAWSGALAALGLATYGQWRALGVRPLLAMLLVYGLMSLPLLDAHAALAGYADLWLAATFGLVVLSWLRWIRQRNIGQLVLAVVLALLMPMIKLEGAVWLSLFGVVMIMGLLPRHWRWRVLGLLTAVVVVGFALGGLHLPILGLGWIHLTWGQVDVPALGQLDLHWRPVGSAMLSGLLTLPNWHLLWYLAPLVIALRWRLIAQDRAARSLAALLGACSLFLFGLFFFTEASAWAENFTSANRLVLHVVPALFSLLALLLADLRWSGSDTGPARPRQTGSG